MTDSIRSGVIDLVLGIASVCHEATRQYNKTIGEKMPRWDSAPNWMRESTVKGVQYFLGRPDAGPEDMHNEWLAQKGDWKWGPEKDPDKKEHPCILPYDELDTEQKKKDLLFIAIVKALT